MQEVEEIQYAIKESTLKELYFLVSTIENPKTRYKSDELLMAKAVISTCHINATMIRTVLDGIINP